MTALMWAVWDRHVVCMQLLLDRGAHVDHQDKVSAVQDQTIIYWKSGFLVVKKKGHTCTVSVSKYILTLTMCMFNVTAGARPFEGKLKKPILTLSV